MKAGELYGAAAPPGIKEAIEDERESTGLSLIITQRSSSDDVARNECLLPGARGGPMEPSILPLLGVTNAASWCAEGTCGELLEALRG